ncbi:Hypothetical protein I5071_63640 [Sandaracinus amylolyticus]|nr:Hypothetical protein I5071_63640 [Sandaracinus amylolyticus]
MTGMDQEAEVAGISNHDTPTLVVATLAFSLFLAPSYDVPEADTHSPEHQFLVETGSSSIAPGLSVPLPVR